MKRFILTLMLLLAICGAFFYALSWPRGMGNELSVAGVLDLTGADFTQTRHNLGGEWEFFFGVLYTPEDFANATAADGTIIEVPGSWHESGFPVHGYATYRLTVITDEPLLMMLIPSIPSASIVWVNGLKVYEAGIISRTGPDVHRNLNAFIPVTTIDGQVEIIVQVTNFSLHVSGLVHRIEIGRADQLLQDALLRRVLLTLFIGMCIAMFGYHFILFLHRRGEWVYLAFALFCLLNAVQFTLEGIFPLFWGGLFPTRTVLVLSVLLKTAVLLAFTHLIFEMPVSKIRLWIYTILIGLPIISTMSPSGIIDPRIVFIIVIPMFMVFFSALRSKRLHGNYYSYLYLIALGAFCVAQPIQQLILGDFLYMPTVIQNLFMILAQFFTLSVSYAQAKEAEQRLAAENTALESLSRMKSGYLANMSHETKTPLTVISLLVQQASQFFGKVQMEDDFAKQTISESLSQAQEEIMRLARFAESSLWIAGKQNESGGLRPVETDALIRHCSEIFRPVLERNNNTLILALPDILPWVYGDADKLIQVMSNILNNANNHTKSGEITVSARSDDYFATVVISDTGTGVDPGMMPRVFERGVSTGSGAGIGLSICKEIIEAHGGTIEIENVEKNRTGATVTFTIPTYNEDERRAGEDEQNPSC